MQFHDQREKFNLSKFLKYHMETNEDTVNRRFFVGFNKYSCELMVKLVVKILVEMDLGLGFLNNLEIKVGN